MVLYAVVPIADFSSSPRSSQTAVISQDSLLVPGKAEPAPCNQIDLKLLIQTYHVNRNRRYATAFMHMLAKESSRINLDDEKVKKQTECSRNGYTRQLVRKRRTKNQKHRDVMSVYEITECNRSIHYTTLQA